MRPKVADFLSEMDALAPFATAEEWDNVGLLAGRSGAEVSRVFITLDLTRETLAEAKQRRAELIIAHHPILFRGRKNLCEDDPEAALLCEMVRSDIAYIASHTCLDRAPGGVADTLAAAFSLRNVETGAEGFLRAGDLPAPMTLEALSALAQETLGASVRPYGPAGRKIGRLAVAPGSAGDFWREALRLGAGAILTGEISHHDALSALENGLCALEAGHFATERPVLSRLAACLQERADMLQWNVEFFVSQYAPWALKEDM